MSFLSLNEQYGKKNSVINFHDLSEFRKNLHIL